MVPNFALSLSFQGIALLRRMGPRWARVDDVAIDSDDLDSAMAGLRDKAVELDPRGAQVLLVIPNEQIRYLDLPDLGGDDSAREAAIRAALDGATPYAVDDLRFDHAISGGRLLIGAVANDTLDEAEHFAAQHGFAPVGFVAIAPEGAFDGAVFFGRANGWRRAADRPSRAMQIVDADEAALTPVAPPMPEPKADDPVPEKDPVPEAAHAPEPIPDTPVAPPAPEQPAVAVKPDRPAPDAPEEPAAPTTASAPEKPVAAPKAKPAPDVPVETQATVADAEKPSAGATPVVKADAAAPSTEQLSSAGAPKTEPSEARATVAPTAETKAPAPSVTASVSPKPADSSAKAAPGPGADMPPQADATAPTPSKPTASEAPSPTFSTVRAQRDAGSVPPAPKALKLGPAAAPGIRPRFTPLAARENAPAEPPKVTADRIESETSTDRPASGGKRFFGGKKDKAGKSGKGKPAKAKMPPPVSAPSGTQAKTVPPAPVGARGPSDPAPESPPLSRPTAKSAPQAPSVKKPEPSPEPPAQGAPNIAARSTAPADKPATGSGNPLARLAALRNETRRATIGAPAARGPALAGAGTTLPTPAEAGRTLTSNSDERERMTVFGERDRGQIGGKPRFLGLLLTTALLLFLAGVAAWASVFLDEGLARLFRGSSEEPAIAALPEEIDATPLTATAPDPSPVPADTPDAPTAPDAEVELAALDPAPEPSISDAPVPALTPAQPAVPRALTPEEAAATYAATGIWQRAPVEPLTPPADGVEDVYVASIDPDVPSTDAIALPGARNMAQEPVLSEPGLPPPAGMTFDIDERGVVRATPEGAVSPDGFRIYAGLPPAVPPLRRPPEPEAPEASPLEEFRGIRPEARPDDVIEQRERITLRGVSLDELSRIRPSARPKTVQEEAADEEPDSPATALAVTASLEPVGRPRNMSAIVERAETRQERQPVQTAAVAPRTVAPTAPSAASVSKAATTRNAINLNRINLIGVYGTPSNRRALVRLASGKYQKVKVGDRLDGGRVSAIGEDDLRYSKGSRTMTLKMPRG